MNKRTRIYSNNAVIKPMIVYSTNDRLKSKLNALYSINKLKTN